MLLPKKPVQGIWGTIEKMLEKYGALNKKYDSNLDGVVDNADKVDGHDAGTSAGNVLVLDTSGKVPLANLPLIPASQLDFSFAWEKVAEISETGVSSIEFTNLAGDTDKIYMLVLAAYNPNTTGCGIYAQFNADTTIGNYGWVKWFYQAGTVYSGYQGLGSTSGTAGALISTINASQAIIVHSIIYSEGITAGTKTIVLVDGRCYGAAARSGNYGGAWYKSAEVTSITLFTGGGQAIDWIAYLFKPKW